MATGEYVEVVEVHGSRRREMDSRGEEEEEEAGSHSGGWQHRPTSSSVVGGGGDVAWGRRCRRKRTSRGIRKTTIEPVLARRD